MSHPCLYHDAPHLHTFDDKTVHRLSVCKLLFIFSCYSRKQIKNGVLFSAKSKNKRLILILYKNIDNPSKPPLNPPKGGFSSFAPRYSSSELDSTLGLASVGKGGLGRFAPGAQIFRVSWLRSTANAVKIAKLKANKSLHAVQSLHSFVVRKA